MELLVETVLPSLVFLLSLLNDLFVTLTLITPSGMSRLLDSLSCLLWPEPVVPDDATGGGEMESLRIDD